MTKDEERRVKAFELAMERLGSASLTLTIEEAQRIYRFIRGDAR